MNRIEILLEKKMIEKLENSSFRLTQKGNGIARRLRLIQQIFSIKESG